MSDNPDVSKNESDPKVAQLKYVFGEKGDVLIVLLTGRLTSRELPLLEKFEAELQGKTQKTVLLSFRGVNEILPAINVLMVRLQANLRSQQKRVALCELPAQGKKLLLMSGVIRESEIYNTVADAWKALNQ